MRRLREAQPLRLVNGLQTLDPVAAHARQNHAHRLAALVLGQRGQKTIDRQRRIGRLGGCHKVQASTHHGECAAGGHDVNGVGHHHHAVVRILNGQCGDPLQQAAQQGFVFGSCVLNHHVGPVRVAWQVCKEFF